MKQEKPMKTVYANQVEVKKSILQELKEKYLVHFREAYLTGSLAQGKFGKYTERYEGYLGSDIDIAGIPSMMDPAWKHLGKVFDQYEQYNLGEITVGDVIHPINLLIPINGSFEAMFDRAAKLNLTVERLV